MFAAAGARIKAAETNKATLFNTNSVLFTIDPKWSLDFDLDNFNGMIIRRNGKVLKISPEELWKELQP